MNLFSSSLGTLFPTLFFGKYFLFTETFYIRNKI